MYQGRGKKPKRKKKREREDIQKVRFLLIHTDDTSPKRSVANAPKKRYKIEPHLYLNPEIWKAAKNMDVEITNIP